MARGAHGAEYGHMIGVKAMEEMAMKKKDLPAAAGILIVVSLMGWVVADSNAGEGRKQAAEETRITRTAPHGNAESLPEHRFESRADRERKYRSCLFTYLPRMGSDVAAEIIRDACKAEYL